MSLVKKTKYLELSKLESGPDPFLLTGLDVFYVTFKAKTKPPLGYDSYELETNLTISKEEDSLTISHNWLNVDIGGHWEYGIGWTGKWNVSPIFADPCDVRKVCGPHGGDLAEAGDYTFNTIVGLYGVSDGQRVLLDSVQFEGFFHSDHVQ